MEKTIQSFVVRNHEVRVIDTQGTDYEYMFVVQIKRKFLFWYYWSILKTYRYKHGNLASETIQRRHALDYAYKLIKSDGKV